MQRFSGWFRDNEGRGYPGAIVTVYNAGTSTKPQLYAAPGSILSPAPIANPFTTDSNGFFAFAVTNGYYDIYIQAGGMPTTVLHNQAIGVDSSTVDAGSVSVTPYGSITSTNVQGALEEIVVNNGYAGVVTMPTHTDNGDGTLTVGDGVYRLHETQTTESSVVLYSVPGATYTMVDNTINYIYIGFSGGVAGVYQTTNRADISNTFLLTASPIFTIYRDGTTLHHLDWDTAALGLPEKALLRTINMERFGRESGLALADAGSQRFSISAGYVWYGVNRQLLDAMASNTDTVTKYVYNGSAWAGTTVTTFENTNYQGASGEVALTSNRYAVSWIYRSVESAKWAYLLLGTGDYTLNQAQAAQPPSNIPGIVSAMGMLVGKIVTQKGNTAASEVDSAFTVSFTSSGVINHNDLAGRTDTGCHPATAITNTPAGAIAATTVQAAINELDTEKVTANTAIVAATKTKISYDTKGLVTSGANATATDIVNTPAGSIAATTVQAAINELDTEKVAANVAISGATKTKITYDAKGLVTGGADAAAADITNAPAGGISSVTVQAAINELDTEKLAITAARERLTAARTYYVRTDGNDSNTGLVDSAEGAFLTPQKGVDTIADTLDTAGYQATIQLRNGTFPNVVFKTAVGSLPPLMVGDTSTPSNVVLTQSGVNAISYTSNYSPNGTWRLSGVRLTAVGSNSNCIFVANYNTLMIDNIDFYGTCALAHIISKRCGSVVFDGNCSISSASPRHIQCDFHSFVYCISRTITISGTPAFSNAFAVAENMGIIQISGCTFSGSATGSRYKVSGNSVIQTGGGGATYLPGDASGTSATGGQYI